MKIVYKHLLLFPLIIGVLYSLPILIAISFLPKEEWLTLISFSPLIFTVLNALGLWLILLTKGYFSPEKFGGLTQLPIHISIEKSVDEVLEILKSSPEFVVIKAEEDLIELKSKKQDFSWGEHIKITKHKGFQGINKYKIDSKPILFLNKFNFGMGLIRVNQICQILSS